nr:hypothetical protein [Anaerolineae bacterium]
MSRVNESYVVMRQWEENAGLHETPTPFASLDELFDLCLKTGEHPLVDRVVIRGVDDKGNDQMLVLSFQSITRQNG